jgi:hypothetical protein
MFRYVSIGDIVDLSPIKSLVRTIDVRVFVSLWCGVDMTKSCYSGLCCAASCDSALSDGYMRCQSTPGLGGSEKCYVYLIQDDCRTTIWTYQENHDGALDQFQPDEELKRRKKISFVRRRRDIYKALGPGSEAEDATLLAFGTLFSGPYKGSESYFDIHAPKIKEYRVYSRRLSFFFLLQR